jgi:hypothetical protein
MTFPITEVIVGRGNFALVLSTTIYRRPVQLLITVSLTTRSLLGQVDLADY